MEFVSIVLTALLLLAIGLVVLFAYLLLTARGAARARDRRDASGPDHPEPDDAP
jgi:ABC-type Na+ efflux pump permease subunit